MPNMTDNELKRDKWVELFCAQVALIITLIVWTEDTQRAIDELENGTENAMKDLYQLLLERIDQLIIRVKAINLT
jgi:dynein heavy chain